MILKLAEAKKYLRIDVDDTDEDDSIQSLIDSAEVYLTNAGCVLNVGDAVAELAIKMLVNHWYNHREPTGKVDLLAFGLSSLIIQLQNCYNTTTTTSISSTTQ